MGTPPCLPEAGRRSPARGREAFACDLAMRNDGDDDYDDDDDDDVDDDGDRDGDAMTMTTMPTPPWA